jgi:hypothetical protein
VQFEAVPSDTVLSDDAVAQLLAKHLALEVPALRSGVGEQQQVHRCPFNGAHSALTVETFAEQCRGHMELEEAEEVAQAEAELSNYSAVGAQVGSCAAEASSSIIISFSSPWCNGCDEIGFYGWVVYVTTSHRWLCLWCPWLDLVFLLTLCWCTYRMVRAGPISMNSLCLAGSASNLHSCAPLSHTCCLWYVDLFHIGHAVCAGTWPLPTTIAVHRNGRGFPGEDSAHVRLQSRRVYG